jgi:RimJ/RimL family protein N-acetyltransferase
MSEFYHQFLTGRQVYLRGLEKEDINGPWFGWFNDQETTYYMYNGIWPTSYESHLEFYERIVKSKNDLVLAICLKDDNHHIGNVGLHQFDFLNRRAELGIIMGDTQAQGRGLATEAMKLIIAHGFNRLNFHKIWLRVDEANGAARKAFQKTGFKEEGILRDELYHHRGWSNSVYMGVLEDEFFEKFPDIKS